MKKTLVPAAISWAAALLLTAFSIGGLSAISAETTAAPSNAPGKTAAAKPASTATKTAAQPAAASKTTAATKSDAAVSSSEKTADKNAAADKTPYNGPPVLEPGQFFGAAAMGYASAKAAPEIMAHLFCYCGCDTTDNHSSLLDCFTSLHGTDCHICQEEAVMALRLHREGASLSEIQKQIDGQYAHYYPWQEDTAAYKKYKASIGKGGAAKAVAGASAGATGNGDACATKSGAPATATAPKLKPGYKAPDCCKKEHK